MPDYLRLVALFGIVVVNVQFIAFSALEGFTPTIEDAADRWTLWLVDGLALLKTYGLFSFMFGVGLGFLMRSAERRGVPFGRIYRNRMIGLLLLGILHGCLFFPGDILTIYAITGSILYLLRNWPVQRLVRLGAALLVAQAVLVPPLLLFEPPVPPEILEMERQFLTGGGFLEVAIFRSIGFATTMPVLLVLQGSAALGWFCLGLAAVRSGLIDSAEHPHWRRARRVCLLPGVALSLLGAGWWHLGVPEWTAPGVLLTTAIAPLATLGYLGLIAALAREPGPLMARVLTAGGASLSVYLGQSIVLSTIFAGYGLGLWGALDRASATLIAICVTVALIAALTLWRRVFPMGPFEWVLRRITYAGTARD